MGAPAILQAIFRERDRNWGPEDDAFTFDAGPGGPGLERVDVFVYRASEQVPMTTFATIGMAAREMPGGERAELHCAVRGPVHPELESAIAVQLANVACFPWQERVTRGLDWGHVVPLSHDFPGFPGCQALFLSGPLTPQSWDYIDAGDHRVKVVNAVPITEAERAEAVARQPLEFIRDLLLRTDIYSPRSAGTT
jgi:hypothetical protein